jgi:hypothetical protein
MKLVRKPPQTKPKQSIACWWIQSGLAPRLGAMTHCRKYALCAKRESFRSPRWKVKLLVRQAKHEASKISGVVEGYPKNDQFHELTSDRKLSTDSR